MVANPAGGQLNGGNVILPSSFALENLVSRDRFYRPVPRPPAYSNTQAEDLPRQHSFGTTLRFTIIHTYLEVYWPCAGGFSAVNAIGTHLRKLGTDPMAYGVFIIGRRRGTREESRK